MSVVAGSFKGLGGLGGLEGLEGLRGLERLEGFRFEVLKFCRIVTGEMVRARRIRHAKAVFCHKFDGNNSHVVEKKR